MVDTTSEESVHPAREGVAPTCCNVEAGYDNVNDEEGFSDEVVNVPLPAVDPEALTPIDATASQAVDRSNTERKESKSAQPPEKKRSKRIVDLYTAADWWSLWIGLISFSVAVALVFLVPYESGSTRARYVVPQPMKWTTNPLDAWDVYGAVGTVFLLTALCGVYLTSLHFMGKLESKTEQSTTTWQNVNSYVSGFAIMSVLATVAFWIGRNEWCSSNGLGYAIFSILFGMFIRNTPLGSSDRLKFLLLTAKDGEFFIKCSLVLLAVEFSVLEGVGLPAIAVAWIGSPVALVAGYLLGAHVFKMEKSVALLVAVGATWCGASAISAIGSVIGARSTDMALSISVVTFFTIAFTFAQPYFAMGVGMSDAVAGAWIGGSVDQTGNVVAAAAIISEEATEVAGVVKIILNSGLGILAAVISLWWQSLEMVSPVDGQNTPTAKRKFSPWVVWDKFPKFVLGFFICSGILTAVQPLIEGTAEGDALQPAVASLNKWWFAVAFVGIGLGTEVRDMWDKAAKSGVIKLYLLANALDIGLALGLAYALF